MATTQATEATTQATEATSDFINKYFTASTIAIDENKSCLSLYKLKDYNTSYRMDSSSLTVYMESNSEVVQYLKTRLEAAKASNSQTALQNWQAYNKPLQQLALEEYKKVFASLDMKKQFDLSCGGQVKLISPTDAEGITLRKNIFTRPILKISGDDKKTMQENKKTMQASLNNELTALQNALLFDSNAKIKKRITNILAIWRYDLSWQSVDAEGIKLLKNLGCLSGVKGNRKNQTKATLLNKIIECVYTRRKRINTNNADNNTDK